MDQDAASELHSSRSGAAPSSGRVEDAGVSRRRRSRAPRDRSLLTMRISWTRTPLLSCTAVAQEPFRRLVELRIPVSHASVGAVLLVTDLLLTMRISWTRTPLLMMTVWQTLHSTQTARRTTTAVGTWRFPTKTPSKAQRLMPMGVKPPHPSLLLMPRLRLTMYLWNIGKRRGNKMLVLSVSNVRQSLPGTSCDGTNTNER
ncbi:uncharacterized protein LOC122371604 isoform X3 [Amphibalanus amphitrite]|uniref:uncharacterized protein LOC122371604 isoform X3 n=1 Tax=Amphibalanus amphitrite TaxID=1232801 RepID=UPI001C928781|nr:uncharacterized protein LOC122371604 isoform X3 [Amphibalanus amphitrite]